MTPEERKRIRDAIDKRQRRRLARAHAQETNAVRAERHRIEDEDSRIAAEHVPTVTEREVLAALRDRIARWPS